MSAARTSFSKRSFNRAAMSSLLAFGPAPARAGRCAVRRRYSPLRALPLLPPGLLLGAQVADDLLAPDALPVRTHHHHVGDGDGRVLLDDAAVGVRLAAALLEVPLHHLHLLDADPALLAQHLEHLAGLALVLPGDDLHQVILTDPHGYNSSGASEMIFMNLRARSSRATGPKMRVPIGSMSLLMSTAEFPSNLM